MTFHSILFGNGEQIQDERPQPEFFVDLNLDQIVNAITAGKEQYDLKPYFYTPLRSVDAIRYRQEISQDLEKGTLLDGVKAFAERMIVARRYLALSEKLYNKSHREGWFLEAVLVYCDAVKRLAGELSLASIGSRGLREFCDYLAGYIDSERFKALLSETKKLKADLSTVRYCVIINGLKVKVRRYEQEIDYSPEVEETFEKFQQGAVEDYRSKLPDYSGMSHVEEQILDMVAKLYPDLFSSLDRFCEKSGDFQDGTITLFDREIQFYVACQEYIARFKRAGLKFCYPQIADRNKEVHDYVGFDLALAHKLVGEKSNVVCNDFFLKDKERIIVVSGPNQGGKTTFARTFGQLHYLAALGCPVPGTEARLFLFDAIFTHFEKEEDIQNLRGKLEDDLVRVHQIMSRATSRSIVIINEIFTSTTLKDAIFLSRKIMEEIIALDLLCVCVSFIDELASLSEKTVSMVSTVVPENPALRTFKILRRPADGLAYAISIAEKYGLTYKRLRERLSS
jgi:hypothetical protein